MSKVSINTQAPDFTLMDFEGNRFQLSELKGEFNAVLVFNRGLT